MIEIVLVVLIIWNIIITLEIVAIIRGLYNHKDSILIINKDLKDIANFVKYKE